MFVATNKVVYSGQASKVWLVSILWPIEISGGLPN
jgi:hypothetical protein